jgi:hypothetical protein
MQKKIKKAKNLSKSRIFLLKAEEVAGLDMSQNDMNVDMY